MKKLVGSQSFHNQTEDLKFNVGDFWCWAYGNLLDNTKRGALAEYLVQRALGLDTSGTQTDWGEYDVLYGTTRIEVKCAAYIQAWNLENEKYSKISFSIRPAYVWDEQTHKYGDKRTNNNDVYIFAVYEERDKVNFDICDLSKWGFYVVLTTELLQHFLGQKTVTLNSLQSKIKVERCSWSNLKCEVDKAIRSHICK